MKKILFTVSAFLFVFVFSIFCFATEYNGYIVRLKDSVSPTSFLSDVTLSDEILQYENGSLYDTLKNDVLPVSENFLLVRANDDKALETLVLLGVVEAYEPDYYMELCAYDVLQNPEYSSQWAYDYINADFAWQAGVTGKDVRVAVIDSGVYPNEDIRNNIVEGYNYCTDMDNYSSSDTTDNFYHGTGVAGIIAAECNGLSGVGLSFNAKIVPLKVVDNSASGVLMSRVINAIEDAVDKYDCDVINLSLTSSATTTSLEKAVKYALDEGVIVVAAAGNSGADAQNGTKYLYPASCDGVVSVANATVSSGVLSTSQSSQRNDKVDIAAPGTDVLTLKNQTSGTVSRSGTSFSTPLVSATAALAKSIDKSITPEQFETWIKETANDEYLESESDSLKWGAGLLDVSSFVKRVMKENGYDKVYVSNPIKHSDGKMYVYLTSLDTEKNYPKCAVTLKSYLSDKTLSDLVYISSPVLNGKTREVCITDYGFDENSTVLVSPEHLPGDVNGDGVVTNRDASAILRILAGYDADVVKNALDVNGDGKVSNRDASIIMRFLAGYLVELN